jgi:hypothetical protein
VLDRHAKREKEKLIMNQRIPILIALLVGARAYANPVIALPQRKAYIDSEKLLATISPTNVGIEATFTFAFAQNTSDPYPTDVKMEIQLWVPDYKSSDPFSEKSWKGTHSPGWYFRFNHPLDESDFEASIALTAHCKNYVLLPLCVEPKVVLPGTYLEPPEYITKEQLLRWSCDPGFSCLILTFSLSPAVVANHWPLTVSYQHPLVHSKGQGRFFYVPNFDNLPTTISTADTNRYSITIAATPDCSLAVTTGQKIVIPTASLVESAQATNQEIIVQGGHTITLTPQHLHPIRALSKVTLLHGD